MLWRIKNPHLKVAVVVAPLLMVLGWGAAEMWWNYQHPELSTDRRPYTLCDLARNDCHLEQGDAKIVITGDYDGDRRLTALRLTSTQSLSVVLFAIGPAGQETPPKRLESTDGRGWQTTSGQIDVPATDPGNLMLRMVAQSGSRNYIGEMKLRY